MLLPKGADGRPSGTNGAEEMKMDDVVVTLLAAGLFAVAWLAVGWLGKE
jgi:hypothetical protein